MLQIKMVEEGSRTIIAIDGLPDERKKVIQEIITIALGADMPGEKLNCVTAPSPIDDVPRQVSLDASPENPEECSAEEGSEDSTEGKLQESPGAFLYRNGVKGLVSLFTSVSSMDEAQRDSVCIACKNYMKNIRHVIQPERMTRKGKQNFISDAVKLYPPEKTQMFWSGYSSLDQFIEFSSEKELDNVLNIILQSLEDRGIN